MIRPILFLSLAAGLNAQTTSSPVTTVTTVTAVTPVDPIEKMVGNVEPTRSIIMKDCGAYCVAIVGSRIQDSAVEFGTAKSLVDPDADGICSMAELTAGLAKLGIESVAMESSGENIPAGLNILHVRATKASTSEDHFIVSEQMPDGRFRFYAPPLGTRVGDGTEIRKIWAGRFVHVVAAGDSSNTSLVLLFASLVAAGFGVWWLRPRLSGAGV